MKKVLKILAFVLGLLLAIAVAGMIVLQSPAAQTRIARNVLERLEGKMDCSITFDQLHAEPFKAVVLHNVNLIDKNPYDNGVDEPMDTIFHAEYVTARFSLKGLTDKRGLAIRDAYVKDALLYLAIEPGGEKSRLNLMRALGIKRGNGKKDKPKSDKDLFWIAKVEVDGMRFRLFNYKKHSGLVGEAVQDDGSEAEGAIGTGGQTGSGTGTGTQTAVGSQTGTGAQTGTKASNGTQAANVSQTAKDAKAANGTKAKTVPEGVIDWSDMDIMDIHLKGKRLRYGNGTMSGKADELSFREKSGYEAISLSGEAKVGNGEALIENILLHDPWSDINIPKLDFTYANTASWGNFIEDVKLEAKIKESTISLTSLGFFARGLKGKDLRLWADGTYKGYVNDFRIDGLQFRSLGTEASRAIAQAGGSRNGAGKSAKNGSSARSGNGSQTGNGSQSGNAIQSGSGSSTFQGRLDGTLTGLPNVSGMILKAKLTDLNFTTAGLEEFLHAWAPKLNLDMSRYASGEEMTFNGEASGPINRLAVKGDLETQNSGQLSTSLDIRNLLAKGRPMIIGGDALTSSLDLGNILNSKALGCLTAFGSVQAVLPSGSGKGGKAASGKTGTATAKATGKATGATAKASGKASGTSSPEITIDSLSISRLGLLGYDYTGIEAAGKISDGAFEGTISCDDPALGFFFQGTTTLGTKAENAVYDFYASVDHADLNAMGIDKKPVSKFSMSASSSFRKTDGKDLLGDLSIQDLQLVDENGLHDIGDIYIVSLLNNSVNRINFTSTFAEGSYTGTKFPTEFVKDLTQVTAVKQLPALFDSTAREYPGNSYDLKLQLHDTRDILSYFRPGLYIADSTQLELNLDTAGIVAGLLTSRRIAYLDKYLKDVSLSVGNSGGNLIGELDADELSASPILTKSNRLLAYANDNHIGLGFSYDNETELANKGEIYLVGDLERTETDSVLLHAEMRPSNIYFNDEAWTIGEAPIEIRSGKYTVDSLLLSNSMQSILIDGGYSTASPDTARVKLTKFDISATNPFISKGALGLGGLATGDLQVISPFKDRFGMLADIAIDSTKIGGLDAGKFRISSLWDESSKTFLIRANDDVDTLRAMTFRGYYTPSSKKFRAGIDFDKFNIGYFAPLTKAFLSSLGGQLSGSVGLDGTMKELDISSEGLALSDASLTVAFTGVTYNLSGPLHMDNNGVYFDGITLHDRYTNAGSVTGKVAWNRFKDISLNTRIKVDRMEVLNIPEGGNPTFYGNVFATGTADLTGPLSAVQLNVNAMTAREGEFHVPMGSKGSAKTSDLLTFKKADIDVYVDPYEQMMQKVSATSEKKSKGGFGCRLYIGVNPGTKAFIEVDKTTGNILTGEGNGQIVVNVQPSRDLFTINGNYNIATGNYHFVAMDIVKRDFTIQDGSTVKFNGDIMDSDLDITAQYRTKTSIGTLISDTTSTARRTVIAQIGITDKLRNPRLKFSIEVPDLDPTTAAKVQSALATDDQVQRQFLSLLISNGFLPDVQSGIVNNSSMLYSSVTEIMSNQLNEILQKLDIPIDMGLDYQQNSSGNDVFDVAVSTQLFNNRVIVNGTIGNRNSSSVYGTSSGNDVVGDIDIEIKVDKPGTVRLNLFSHSADQYTNYLDNSQRNGVGVTYQRDFTTFGNLWRSLWHGKKWKKAHEAETIEQVETKTISAAKPPKDSAKKKDKTEK